ncbi:hypothetical protein ABZ370_35760 [Streptomyces sp. NPDC005962]|uniref:hypothetical protein n=1 Tax=Streptomyces sp. NPDC005962 TaxID=3154466 RepID=UPI0033DAF7D9
MTRFRNAVERLAKGSSALCLGMGRGVVAWLKAGEKLSDFVIRLFFLALPVWVAWSLLMATTAVMWGFLVVWCIAARAVQPPKEAKQDEPALHPEDLAELPWELAGDRKGVRLSTVAEQLTRETPERSWSVPGVKALLKAAGISSRHSVRVPGVGVAVGVHRQDIPGSPSPRPRGSPSRRCRAPGQPGYSYTRYALHPRLRGRGQRHLHPGPAAAQQDARQGRPAGGGLMEYCADCGWWTKPRCGH